MPAPPTSATVLTHVTVLQQHGPTGAHWVENQFVGWENGRITHVGPTPPSQMLLNHDDVTVLDANGLMLTPGLVDIHINGAYGCDFAHATPNQIHACLKKLAATGVTSIVPTIITAPHEDMMASIQTLEEAIRQPQPGAAHIVGLHLEGPLLNPAYSGIHNPGHMQGDAPGKLGPTVDIKQVASLCSPSVIMMTLAPECVPVEELLPFLHSRGITVLAGHTGASTQQIAQAMDHGLTGITHLFNAMKPLHHRSPGPIAMALTQPGLHATLIADGAHVYPEALRVALSALGCQRGILVSDAIHLAGTPEGTQTDFAGQSITHVVDNGLSKAVNADGTLAGSAALLADGVRNVVRWQLTDSATALAMATHTPASYLGKDQQLGHITPGTPADAVLWQPDFTPAATWINGHLAYQAQDATTQQLFGTATGAQAIAG